MALELHIWGPAFGLPSIDPESLAALSYLGHVVPPGDWSLIASNDAALSPDQALPALHHNGTWTSGYTNIVTYLGLQNPAWSIDDGSLSRTQQADTLAHASYVQSRGSALVAFSLYVSPSAWADLTRPAYSALLPFPLTWTVPLRIRSAAVARTEHFGLDHLAADVDPADGSSASGRLTAPTTSTGFLRLPVRQTVSESMAPEQAAAIRLQSITEDFFAVLDELRGEGPYFFGRDSPSSLDFLVLGYLELLRVRTPHPFMETCMKRSGPGSRLAQFLDHMHRGPVRWQGDSEQLPWVTPSPRGIARTLGQFAENVVQNAPGAGDAWRQWSGEGVKAADAKQDPTQVLLTVGSVVAALAAVGGAMVFRSLPPFGEPTQRFEAPKPQKGGLHRFGDIGAIFDDLPDFGAAPPPQDHTQTVYQGDGVEVAVDVEQEGFGSLPPRDSNVAEVGVGVKVGDNARSQ